MKSCEVSENLRKEIPDVEEFITVCCVGNDGYGMVGGSLSSLTKMVAYAIHLIADYAKYKTEEEILSDVLSEVRTRYPQGQSEGYEAIVNITKMGRKRGRKEKVVTS